MTAPLSKGAHYVAYSESLTLWSIVILPYCSFYDAMLISQSFFKPAKPSQPSQAKPSQPYCLPATL